MLGDLLLSLAGYENRSSRIDITKGVQNPLCFTNQIEVFVLTEVYKLPHRLFIQHVHKFSFREWNEHERVLSVRIVKKSL